MATAARPKVLIVDDCRFSAQNVAQTFDSRGFDVAIASDGLRGLELSRKECFDLVVLDIDLPFISGLGLLKQLRESPSYSEVPILMLTARHNESDRERALSTGANGCLSKPLRVGPLRSMVDELV